MIYRIDLKHYLTHAIDHFTRDELNHFYYVIISASISNQAHCMNVTKCNELYPTGDLLQSYYEYEDKESFEKAYMDMLKPKGSNVETNYTPRSIYKSFIDPLVKHMDVMIVCDESENFFIDVLCKYMKEEYQLEVIDLNQLFSKGRVGPIYIDRDKIWDSAVKIRRIAGKEMQAIYESSRDGRFTLLKLMKKQDKIAKLKELGITVTAADMKDLDKLLMEEWVENEEFNRDLM